MKQEAVTIRDVGRVKEIKRSIIKVDGLSECMLGQIVHFSDGTKGFVMGFSEDDVLTLLLGSSKDIKAGEAVYAEEEAFKIPVGRGFIGRIIGALCEPLDGKGHIKEDSFSHIFREAPQVLDRIPIDEMLETGIRIIDSSIPIGKGQRQLIIGDRMTGKTSIAIGAILNQKNKHVICIYCCIGRDYASFERVVGILKENGALDYTIVVSALASSSIGEQYLAPYTAAALGEYFMFAGEDVLVVFDDLTRHAWAYRELSLLLERPPGREAYPGDIFYLHAQLMERAARLSPERGGGSMTFLPIADTLHGDIAGFIPTNIISMTDGQIYLSSDLFGEGFKPAVDVGLSVSRVGSRVQPPALRDLSKDLALDYIRYREMLKATRLRAAISDDLAKRLRHGEKLERIFIQDRNKPSPLAEQIILFYALKEGIFDVLSNDKCEEFKNNVLGYAQKNFGQLVNMLNAGVVLDAAGTKELRSCIVKFFKAL